MNLESGISLRTLVPNKAPNWVKRVTPAFDRVLGIDKFDRIYRQNRLQGLPPFEFAERAVAALELDVLARAEDFVARVPRQGPVIMVCNHPFGGIEALILMRLLRKVREDVKFLANSGLQVFRELRPLFIATDPLRVSQSNLKSIRCCEAHLAGGGLLMIFPAGKVSFRPRGEQRVRDAQWNRIVGFLARRTEAALLPVFFHGANSPLFHFLGALWDRSKLLLLPREFMRMRGRRIRVEVGHAMPAPAWRHLDETGITRFARFMTYALEAPPPPVVDSEPAPESQEPLAALGSPAAISAELAALPAAQHLLDFKQFSVFYARAAQIPVLMDDIARERERVFRQHDEGSGAARDGDAFDQTYVQLFAWDHAAKSLVGAYRMGPTDRLREPGGGGLYLSRMFDFDEAFYSEMPAALELGRSFVVPEHQKNYHSLYLLWRGIGQYLVRHPRYRQLYGTVSLSRQYDPRAIAVICDSLIEPSSRVRPRVPLNAPLHPEWAALRGTSAKRDLPTVSACVRGLDAEGKDIPVLLRHYHRLGARFLCVGVDRHFNDTPGLLLRVNMERVAPRVLSTYLARGMESYLAWRPDDRAGAPGAHGAARRPREAS
ncbi:MAG: GNAT family N-acyltransferase [Xanthomonadales bacterium]|nr:GNAT family N-acyltransferase [Xanthomonadales bacterium]